MKKFKAVPVTPVSTPPEIRFSVRINENGDAFFEANGTPLAYVDVNDGKLWVRSGDSGGAIPEGITKATKYNGIAVGNLLTVGAG